MVGVLIDFASSNDLNESGSLTVDLRIGCAVSWTAGRLSDAGSVQRFTSASVLMIRDGRPELISPQ